MKKNIIAVCDSDAEYACNFAEYLNNKKKLPFQAEAFTNAQTLCDYAGKNPPEILLIAEGDVDSRVENLGAENLIVLSDERDREEEQHKCVYKYQSAESIIQEVMTYYANSSSPAFYAMSERRMSVLGVYSPVARCGKTLFALTADSSGRNEVCFICEYGGVFRVWRTVFHADRKEVSRIFSMNFAVKKERRFTVYRN